MADFLSLGDLGRWWQIVDALRQRIPTACVLCGERTQGGGLCSFCVADWHYRYKYVRWRCQRCKVAQLGGVRRAQQLCQRCLTQPQAWHALAVAFDYVAPLDSLIWRFKNYHQLRLAPMLARMMQQAMWRDGWAHPTAMVVTAIPSRRQALRRRGFNPAMELARYLARYLGLPLASDLLALAQPKADQAQKHRTQSQRWAHAQHAFIWRGAPPPETLLLVDDVLTTGSTLHSAACCALNHGVKQVYAVTLARVPWTIL